MLPLSLHPVRDARERAEFLRFPWQVNRGDPFWVPPLLRERQGRLEPGQNPFWQAHARELWLARRGAETLGTIAAFHPLAGGEEGRFGFFDCRDDLDAARALCGAAEDWLRARGASRICGPFNPGENDEPGVLVAGFGTRPALMEGHNPPYYPALFERMGYERANELVARLFIFPPGCRELAQAVPERLLRAAERVSERGDLRIKTLDTRRWEEQIHLAWEIFAAAQAGLPGVSAVPWPEFWQTAQGFRPFLQPELALLAEVGGKAVGFVLALPDLNEAIQPLNGRIEGLNLLRLWWRSRSLRRVTFKILMILPEYQGRGIEAALIRNLADGVLKRGYREVDLSLTGENNLKSQRFQEHLDLKVYRRYRIYQKRI